MIDKKILLIVFEIFFGASYIFSQDIRKSELDSMLKLPHDTIFFDFKEVIDNITVQGAQKLYDKSEYDSVVYFLYRYQDIKYPFAIIPESKFNSIDKSQFNSMRISSLTINRKKILEFHMYISVREFDQ